MEAVSDHRTRPQVTALAAMFGVCPATIRQWIKRDHLKRRPDGTIDLESVREHAEKRTNLTPVA